ncbi:MAG: hypothetical protein HY912_10015 [Desulfomonile tiedjei]|uniref:Uncharacterized protein n=1 Tax=Desulfomonile tiedjei TaxID=2358 RepID=A0A9D6V377_9BACT|nr:hypothetical protein [Desulfomonile tiedjei]
MNTQPVRSKNTTDEFVGGVQGLLDQPILARTPARKPVDREVCGEICSENVQETVPFLRPQ